MDEIVLLKIETLQARVVQPEGLKLRKQNRDLFTGTITAILDESAPPPANMGLLNATTGGIRLQWAIVATLPITADAYAAGQLTEKESALVRVTFDEVGEILEDSNQFQAIGSGDIAPGSVLTGVKITSQSNGFLARMRKDKKASLRTALASGVSVGLSLLPESTIELALPKTLGGGTQTLNLAGGFVLVPIMALGGARRATRARRR